MKRRRSVRIWLTAAVLAHLAVSIVHGAAHAQAQVPLSRAANLFVFIVILAGPPIGLALMWRAERIGSWLVAVTMAGSLVFGIVNHFVLASPDHVAHVRAEWRPLFASTAALLAVTEALGLALAIGSLGSRRGPARPTLPPATDGDNRPRDLDQAKRPGALKKAVHR
jgi:hypothetical protein